jgi:hypothetical protein
VLPPSAVVNVTVSPATAVIWTWPAGSLIICHDALYIPSEEGGEVSRGLLWLFTERRYKPAAVQRRRQQRRCMTLRHRRAEGAVSNASVRVGAHGPGLSCCRYNGTKTSPTWNRKALGDRERAQSQASWTGCPTVRHARVSVGTC